MRRVAIDEFLTESKNALLIDVRSPSEYRHAHIPGAISLPLFSDEERAVVGTEYKQVSRQAAIKIGLDYFGPKMRKMVEEVERLTEQMNGQAAEHGGLNANVNGEEGEPQTLDTEPQTQNLKVFIYCWRGGMRSGAVAWLLNLYGFNVTVLAGGYKSFRNWVLQTLSQPHTFCLLGGYTGSGKTAILENLKQQGQPVINLEELARHKGSAFGNIGLPPQPSQEMFENTLGIELQAINQRQKGTGLPFSANSAGGIWMEDESQRIGQVNVPEGVWLNMRRSPIFFLEIPFEERLQYLVQEYGCLDKSRMIAAIERITKRLGGLEAKNAKQFLEEGNTVECFRILLRYYDKQYHKGLHNRESLSSLLTKIPCETVTEKNAALLSQAQFVS